MKKNGKTPYVSFRMLPKSLAALRAAPASTSGRRRDTSPPVFWPEDTFEFDPDEWTDPPSGSHPDAIRCLVAAAFEAATSGALRRRLHHGQALAAVILVPTEAWVAPTEAYFGETFGDRWRLVGPSPAPAAVDASRVEMEIASHLTTGHCAACICADVSRVPRTLIAAADITVRIRPPPVAVLHAAIGRFTKRAAPRIPSQDGGGGADPAGLGSSGPGSTGLDLPEIVACFRPGTGPGRIAQRLVAAATALKAHDPQPREDGRMPPTHPPADAGADSKEFKRC